MERSTRVFLSLCIAAGLALGYTILFGSNRAGMVFIGDLPGFFGIGRIVLEGHGERLYDFSLQREIQNAYWPSLAGTFLPTMYPPFFAAFIAPFTAHHRLPIERKAEA